MRTATESVYPNDIDPLFFYQDANIEKRPLLYRYYELLRNNDFTGAKNYLQSIDVDYYGSWFLNTIEKRLRKIEQYIPTIIGEKPKLVMHRATEPANSEYTEECFCWTGDSGKRTFWHESNTNPLRVVDGQSFYFQRYPGGIPGYGGVSLYPTHYYREGLNQESTINDISISAYEIPALKSQQIIFPLYDLSMSEMSEETLRLCIDVKSIEVDENTTDYQIGHSAELYDSNGEYYAGTRDDATWTAYNNGDSHFYLFAGKGTIASNNRGTSTISNVLYFGLIHNYSGPSGTNREMFFHGCGIDLDVLRDQYYMKIPDDFVPDNPLR